MTPLTVVIRSVMRFLLVLCAVLTAQVFSVEGSVADDKGIAAYEQRLRNGFAELARLQTDLNHVAAGQAAAGGLSGPEERLLAAFSAGWGTPDADPARAVPILAEIETETNRHLAEALAYSADPQNVLVDHHFVLDLTTYVTALDAVAPAGADPLVRLIAAMHRVDGTIIMDHLRVYSFDFSKRTDATFFWGSPEAANAWLRIPCRTLIGREESFRRAYSVLGRLSGPVLDCPTPADGQSDVDAMDRFARDPGGDAAAVVRRPKPAPVVPPPDAPAAAAPDAPWDHETAVANMIDDPERAGQVLARAATPGEKLDFALYLFAFRPGSPERDEQIRSLLPAIDPADQRETGMDAPVPFDGSADSLIAHLRWDSESGSSMTGAYFVIPCGVLERKPGLLPAIAPYYSGNRDNFLPRSGCRWGRGWDHGFVTAFPNDAVYLLQDAGEWPTGRFVIDEPGTMRFMFQGRQSGWTRRACWPARRRQLRPRRPILSGRICRLIIGAFRPGSSRFSSGQKRRSRHTSWAGA
jgi:hypothetical protein